MTMTIADMQARIMQVNNLADCFTLLHTCLKRYGIQSHTPHTITNSSNNDNTALTSIKTPPD